MHFKTWKLLHMLNSEEGGNVFSILSSIQINLFYYVGCYILIQVIVYKLSHT